MSSQLEFIRQNEFDKIWDTEDTDAEWEASIWKPKSKSGYYSLGHYAKDGSDSDYDSDEDSIVMVRDHPALVKPDSYKQIWSTDDMSDGEEMSLWQPEAKDAVCLGFVASDDKDDEPNDDDIRCIKLGQISNLPRYIEDGFVWSTEDMDTNDDASIWKINDLNTFVAHNSDSTSRPPDYIYNTDKILKNSNLMNMAGGISSGMTQEDCFKLGIPADKCSDAAVRALKEKCNILGINNCSYATAARVIEECTKYKISAKDCNYKILKNSKEQMDECQNLGIPNKYFTSCNKKSVKLQKKKCMDLGISPYICTPGMIEDKLDEKNRLAQLAYEAELKKIEAEEQRNRDATLASLAESALKPRTEVTIAAGSHGNIIQQGVGDLPSLEPVEESMFSKYKIWILSAIAGIILMGIIFLVLK